MRGTDGGQRTVQRERERPARSKTSSTGGSDIAGVYRIAHRNRQTSPRSRLISMRGDRSSSGMEASPPVSDLLGGSFACAYPSSPSVGTVRPSDSAGPRLGL
jgi:hypothetical protein